MDYIEVSCKVKPLEPFTEIVIARLAEAGFEMFEENESGVKAYITRDNYSNDYKDLFADLEADIRFEEREVPHENWNAVWESNFEPVVLADKVYIKAAFHEERPEYPYTILIQPKMAFGTGHHATTSQVMEAMLPLEWKDKVVMDMGCGTGILAILAYLLGARDITAIDNDPVAAENASENCSMNGADTVTCGHGDAKDIIADRYDIFIANINRNIILNDIAAYVKGLKANGLLILSGFYREDIPMITEAALSNNLVKINESERDRWCCLMFRKNK